MTDKKISALTGALTPLDGTEVLPIVQSGATVKVANNALRPKQIQSNATSGVLQVVGPGTAATRVMTTPDANFTVARTDAAQSFTGDQGFTNSVAVGSSVALNYQFQATTNVAVGAAGFSQTLILGNQSIQSVTLGVANTTLQLQPNGADVSITNGNLVIGTSGKGIDFSATPGTGTSELFADYEEGTWTPGVTFGGAAVGVTYGVSNAGQYTKVGRMMTVCGILDLSSKGTSVGNISITGLPTAGSIFGGAALTLYGLTFTGQAYGQPNASAMVLYQILAGTRTVLTNTAFQNDTSIAMQITYYV